MLDADNDEEDDLSVMKEKMEYIPTRLQRIMEDYAAHPISSSVDEIDEIPEISRSYEDIVSLDDSNRT